MTRKSDWEKIGKYFDLYTQYHFDAIKAGVYGKPEEAKKLQKKSRYYQIRHDNLFHKVTCA